MYSCIVPVESEMSHALAWIERLLSLCSRRCGCRIDVAVIWPTHESMYKESGHHETDGPEHVIDEMRSGRVVDPDNG